MPKTNNQGTDRAAAIASTSALVRLESDCMRDTFEMAARIWAAVAPLFSDDSNGS